MKTPIDLGTLGSDPFEEILKILQTINMRTDLTRRMD